MTRLVCILLCFMISNLAAAQEPACLAPSTAPDAPVRPCKPRTQPHVDQVPDVASLKTPEAPAFMALGLAPSEIQRPTTPTGLKASLANGFSGGALPLLQNFALEVSPYWLFPHRKLSYEQVVAEPHKAWFRNVSLSFATGPREVGNIGSKITYGNFAVGGRTTIWPGRETRVAKQCVAYIKRSLEQSAEARGLAIVAFVQTWTLAHPAPQPPQRPSAELELTQPEEYDRLLKEYKAKLQSDDALLQWARAKEAASEELERTYVNDKKDPRYERCLSDLHSREGFMAEVAGAYTFGVPRGDIRDFKSHAYQLSTGWLTAGWVQEDFGTPGLEGSLLAVGRVQNVRGSLRDIDERSQAYDFGGRAAVAFERFGLAIEATRRWRHVDEGYDLSKKLWRTALSVDYRLASGIWLTGTFGKDFGTDYETPFIALANLQWNFGLERGVQPDRGVTQ